MRVQLYFSSLWTFKYLHIQLRERGAAVLIICRAVHNSYHFYHGMPSVHKTFHTSSQLSRYDANKEREKKREGEEI